MHKHHWAIGGMCVCLYSWSVSVHLSVCLSVTWFRLKSNEKLCIARHSKRTRPRIRTLICTWRKSDHMRHPVPLTFQGQKCNGALEGPSMNIVVLIWSKWTILCDRPTDRRNHRQNHVSCSQVVPTCCDNCSVMQFSLSCSLHLHSAHHAPAQLAPAQHAPAQRAPAHCTPHTCTSCTCTLCTHVQQLNCCVKKRQTFLWPPNSPDLSSVDYKIWAVMQHRVYHRQIHSVDELIWRLIDVWCGLEQSIFDEAIDQSDEEDIKRVSMLKEDILSTACELTVLILSIFVTFNVICLTVTSLITKSCQQRWPIHSCS